MYKTRQDAYGEGWAAAMAAMRSEGWSIEQQRCALETMVELTAQLKFERETGREEEGKL